MLIQEKERNEQNTLAGRLFANGMCQNTKRTSKSTWGKRTKKKWDIQIVQRLVIVDRSVRSQHSMKLRPQWEATTALKAVMASREVVMELGVVRSRVRPRLDARLAPSNNSRTESNSVLASVKLIETLLRWQGYSGYRLAGLKWLKILPGWRMMTRKGNKKRE